MLISRVTDTKTCDLGRLEVLKGNEVKQLDSILILKLEDEIGGYVILAFYSLEDPVHLRRVDFKLNFDIKTHNLHK